MSHFIFNFISSSDATCADIFYNNHSIFAKTVSTPSEIISNRVCGIWLGIGEDVNIIISK